MLDWGALVSQQRPEIHFNFPTPRRRAREHRIHTLDSTDATLYSARPVRVRSVT